MCNNLRGFLLQRLILKMKSVTQNITCSTKVLFVTSGSHTSSDKNLNHFQRVYFLSRSIDLTVLARRDANFSISAAPGTQIVRSPWAGKIGLIFYATLLFLKGQARQYDIIVSEPSVLCMVGFLAKILGGCRWVVDVWDIPIRCHTTTMKMKSLRCWLTRKIFRVLFHWADLFIVSIIPDFELRSFKIRRDRMLRLKNAIWLEDSRGSGHSLVEEKAFMLLCMRSVYTKQMGLDTLTEAIALLKKRLPGFNLTIIGHIPQSLEYQVAQLRRMSEIRFLDFVEHSELKRLIDSASICVVPFHDVPDLAQTYPVKIVEYLAQGKPVVASNIAGIRELIRDGENGLLFKAGDAQDLAAKICLLHEDDELFVKIAENASKLVDDFDCRVKNSVIVETLKRLACKA